MSHFKLNLALAGTLVALGLVAYWLYFPEQSESETQVAALSKQVERLAAQVQDLSSRPVRERIIDLPEDGRRWHLVTIYKDKALTDANDRRLAALLAATPRLQALRAQTTVNTWDRNDPLYKTRYQKFLGGEAPAIVLQTDDGKVCYLARGSNIPLDGERLADEIAAAIEQCRPPLPRPNDTPNPVPGPRPSPQPSDEPIPDIRPARPAEENVLKNPNSLWWLLLIPVAAGALGIWRHRKN
jgi:hypothetical protein